MILLAATDDSSGTPWLPGAMLAAGVLAVTIVSLRIWMRNRRKVRDLKEGPSPRERLDAMSMAHQRDSIETLMVELQDIARSCAAQVENRAAKLETLMRQTDARIEALRAALDEPAPKPAPAPAPQPTTEPQVTTRQAAPAGQGLRLQTERDAKTARVLELHGAGSTPQEIAKALNEEIGRVQLILSLNGARVSA